MKKSLIPVILFLSIISAAQVLAAEIVPLNSENDRVNYSVGYQIGGDFLKQGVAMNAEALVQGIRDALEQGQPRLSAQEMTTTLQNLKKKIVADARLRQDRQGQDFLVENLKKEGVVGLPNGIQYRVIQAGAGAKPTMQDSVKINFLTKMTNGTIVSDTFQANEPKIYPMAKVMPGLQTVLPMMSEGSRWEVVIPTGHEGRRAKEVLDKRGTLIYEIKLLSVIPADKK